MIKDVVVHNELMGITTGPSSAWFPNRTKLRGAFQNLASGSAAISALIGSHSRTRFPVELSPSRPSLARNFLEAEWSPERADFNSLGVSVNVLYVAPSRPDCGRSSVGCL